MLVRYRIPSIRWLGVWLPPLDEMLVHRRVCFPRFPEWRDTVEWSSCMRKKHSKMNRPTIEAPIATLRLLPTESPAAIVTIERTKRGAWMANYMTMWKYCWQTFICIVTVGHLLFHLKNSDCIECLAVFTCGAGLMIFLRFIYSWREKEICCQVM